MRTLRTLRLRTRTTAVDLCRARGNHRWEGPPGHDPRCRRCGVLKSLYQKLRDEQEARLAAEIAEREAAKS